MIDDVGKECKQKSKKPGSQESLYTLGEKNVGHVMEAGKIKFTRGTMVKVLG